ncbi:MAG: hypothetical protein JWO32_3136 [Bacteroidetes bacterium]|nr:hypothetical protein [Bacteroidota bacterium]
MKRILPCFFVLLFLALSQSLTAQVFWTETFGTGTCAGQGNVASTGVPTASNGAWTISNGTGLPNGVDANEWFISSTEAGMGVGSCGDGCLSGTGGGLTNRTLHVGSNSFGIIDPGAAYLAGGSNFDTNKQAESPTINCTGRTNITLALGYFVEGIAGVDYAELLYSANNGGTWSVLGPLPTTNNTAACTGTAAGQGIWTALSIPLPASANNNATVKLAIRWESSDPFGADPSIAIDDVVLATTAAISFTIPSTACANQTVQATVTSSIAGTTSYSWTSTPGGAVFVPATSGSPAVSFPSAGAYTVTVFALNGASVLGSSTQTITVNTQPTVAVVPATQTICAGNTATLTANATAGSTFQWATGTFPLITPLGTASTQTVSPAATTSYSVLATIGSCTAFATTTVTIGSNLTINATASATQVCNGAATTLSASGATSYTWASPSNNNIGTSPSVVVTPSVNTTYTVTGSNGSCTGTQTISINVTNNVAYTVSATAATVCPGQPVGLTVTGGVNYTWSPASSLSSPTGSAVIASPQIPTTYTVVGNNGAGCNGSGFITINMASASPLQVVSTASAVCTGFSSTLTASGATSYTWSGSTMSTTVNQSSIAVGPGSYTVQGSNGGSCASQTVVSVSLAPPLNVAASQNSFTTCIANNFPKFSKPVQLTASGASSYNWFPCNSYISICIGPVVQVRPPTSTCYTITGNTSVCSGSAVICVTVIPQYTVTVTPPLPIMCTGDSLKLKVANIGTVSVAPFTYSWADPEPISIYNPLDFSVTAFPTNTTTNPRSVTYTTEVLDSRGCISVEKLVTVTVVPRPITAVSIPTINGVPTNTLCFVGNSTGVPDVTLTLCANNTNSLPPQYNPTFTWVPTYTTPAGPILTQNPTSGPQSCVIVSAPHRTPTPMTFTVVSGYNGIPGCRREDTVSVIAVDCRSVTPFSFTTATTNDTICSRQCITYLAPQDTTFGGPLTYTWNFPGGNPNVSNLKNPTVCYNLPGRYNALLTVHNPYPLANAAGSSYTRGYLNFIKVVDIPNPQILPQIIFQRNPKDTVIRFGASIVLTATNAVSYIWDPPYNISPLTGSVVTVNPLQTTQYHVKGYNSSQCYSNDTINVIVIDDCGEMFVPNAFSPNGDGANDKLYVRGLCLETLTFLVFNRWGEKVFETNDKSIGWDGTYKGELLNTGVFVFRLEGKTYDGKGYSMKGNVTLVR